MNSKALVVEHVRSNMVREFGKGNLVDAQNLHAFLINLEGMALEEYDQLTEEAALSQQGSIS